MEDLHQSSIDGFVLRYYLRTFNTKITVFRTRFNFAMRKNFEESVHCPNKKVLRKPRKSLLDGVKNH